MQPPCEDIKRRVSQASRRLLEKRTAISRWCRITYRGVSRKNADIVHLSGGGGGSDGPRSHRSSIVAGMTDRSPSIVVHCIPRTDRYPGGGEGGRREGEGRGEKEKNPRGEPRRKTAAGARGRRPRDGKRERDTRGNRGREGETMWRPFSRLTKPRR